MSWEQLTALADAHERRAAEFLIQLSIAAQGDDKSWKAQIKHLQTYLKK